MRRLLHRRPFLSTLPTVGVSISDVFVAVSIRADPPRLTGLYRCRLDHLGGIDAGDAGLGLAAAAKDARRSLRLPEGTPAVMALEPVEPAVRVPLIDGWGLRPLRVAAAPGASAALASAGFVVERFDALPAALARFSLRTDHQQARIWAAGWAVSASADLLEGTASRTPVVPTAGFVDRRGRSPLELDGIRIPAALRRHLRTDRDAPAIGAALRGLGFPPDLMVEVEADPSAIPVGEAATAEGTW